MSSIDIAPLGERLIRGRNSDGGWPYYAGKASRLEPTAWAALALQDEHVPDAARALAAWPSNQGLLLEHRGGGPNFGFHGLALLALDAFDLEHAAGTASLVAGLQRVKGIALSAPSGGRQDNSLQAWSWIADTFSWVEPTGWCLLALKKRRRTAPGDVDDARVTEAERLLINRVCTTGGWNYGNPDMLGKDLHAYVPTTALGVLAMQDRQDEEAVRRSVDFLAGQATSEPSASALALAVLALQACKRDAQHVRRRLIEQLPMTLEIGHHAAIAMAVVALSTEPSSAFSL
jgi:hypothetical protein